MTNELRAQWHSFLEGRWLRIAPTAPGKYPIANSAGIPCGFIVVYPNDGSDSTKSVSYAMNGRTSADPTDLWGGWWWSHSSPSLPLAHKFNSESDK